MALKMINFKQFITEDLKPISGTQYGSNPGGVHEDENGTKHYIKHYSNSDQAKVEALTGKIYHHMGIKTVKPEMHDSSSIKSKWNEDLHQLKPKHFENLNKKQAHQIGKMYHGAILTKNWDIVGLEHDNILHNKKTKDLHAIDHGGAFHFRARGSHKDYDSDIHEKESLRDPGQASGHVFNNTFKNHPEAEHKGLEAVRKMNDEHLHHLFKNSGLSNWKELHKNFMSRKKKLLNSYKK